MHKQSLQRGIEKLAIAGQQAGLSIEQMIELLGAGLSVETLLDLVLWRLGRSNPVKPPSCAYWVVDHPIRACRSAKSAVDSAIERSALLFQFKG